MAHVSSAEDLALHGPRILGFASAGRVAARFGLDREEVAELLLDHESRGWVGHTSFGGSSGWSLTGAGRVENERRLADELARTGARELVADAHRRFLPLNARFSRTVTEWQVRPVAGDPLAANDHSDWGWDARVLDGLAAVERSFGAIADGLATRLARFDGYRRRYASARARAEAGQPRWVDSPEVDSCHTVWIQLHEDLLATLGISRGSDG